MQKAFFTCTFTKLLKTTSWLFFLGFTSLLLAQAPPASLKQLHNMTPEQQSNYVTEARKRGYTLLQLEGLAKTRGATPAD